mgnify:CR=1 FL=1
MSNQIIVPSLGESITEATVSKWLKQVGEKVDSDEPLVELETDKVTLEVPSPVTGKIEKISFNEGDTVAVGTVLGSIDETATPTKTDKPQKIEKPKEPENQEAISTAITKEVKEVAEDKKEKQLSPSTRKIVVEKNINSNNHRKYYRP